MLGFPCHLADPMIVGAQAHLRDVNLEFHFTVTKIEAQRGRERSPDGRAGTQQGGLPPPSLPPSITASAAPGVPTMGATGGVWRWPGLEWGWHLIVPSLCPQ